MPFHCPIKLLPVVVPGCSCPASTGFVLSRSGENQGWRPALLNPVSLWSLRRWARELGAWAMA